MNDMDANHHSPTLIRLERRDFDCLFDALHKWNYEVIGPTLQEESILYGVLNASSDLPIGWTDMQEAGLYRVKKRPDNALFGYNVGPHSWKQFLFPPKHKLWQAEKKENGFQISTTEPKIPQYAFLGVRSCELSAIFIQDKVFMGESYQDPTYAARRSKLFIIAVNCGQAGGTCFCVSMGTGPKATTGFDLALTEVLNESEHYFLVEVGSGAGASLIQEIPHTQAQPVEIRSAEVCVATATSQMGRQMNTAGIKELLYQNYEHPRWDDVAQRCLTCANCTLVCPTCFCSTVVDSTDLTGEHAERWREWDSCFTMDFSYVHGAGSVRPSNHSRYRQWLTHKVATWIDQFDISGCVGCGRCITWCPVGIDITAEIRAIRENDQCKETPL